MLVFSGTSVAENGTGGELAGTLSIVGPDFTGPVTYSITSDPSLNFEISGAGLDELRVKAGVSFDFETASSYPVGLQGIDSTAGTPKTFSTTISVTVLNVNEPPANIDLSGTTVADDAADGFVIGVLSNPLDPDAGDIFTWSIAPGGDPSGNFEVAGTDFRVAAGNTLNNAVNASHNVTFRVTDAGGLTFDKAFTISVTAAISLWKTTGLPNQVAGFDASREASSAAIGTWADYFGVNDAVQTTEAAKPRNDLVTLNGLQVMSFDGIDDTFDLTAQAALLNLPAGDNTIICLTRRSVTAAVRIYTATVGVGSRHYLTTDLSAANTLAFRSGNSFSPNVSIAAPVNTWEIFVASRSGTTQSLSKNGGAAITDSNASNVTCDGSYIGSYKNLSGFWNGEIAQIMFFDAALSTADIQKAEGRLAHKFGLQANLPSSHPYKTNAPTV